MSDTTTQTLYIIRGLPASGKTTLARQLAPNDYHEADQYMTDNSGNYKFDPKKLVYAHNMCKAAVIRSLEKGAKTIAVSNTFTQRWEFEPYIAIAKMLGAAVKIEITTGQYADTKGIPEWTIANMKKRWED